MKVLNFICDKCYRVVGTQKTNFGEQVETHLLPMGYREWCFDCIDQFNKELLDPIPKKQKILYKKTGH